MSVTVVTPPTSPRLTTLAAAITSVGTAVLGQENGLPLIQGYIDAASAAIASYTHRPWGHGTVTELLPGTNTPYLGLTWTPLTTAGTVTEDDTAITDWIVDDAAASRLYREAGWGRGVSLGWGRDAWSSGYILSSPRQGDWEPLRYSVTYAAGYVLPGDQEAAGTAWAGTVTLPADVQQACLETVRFWYQERSHDPFVLRNTVGDVTVTYGAIGIAVRSIPPLAQALLQPWRRAPFQPGV